MSLAESVPQLFPEPDYLSSEGQAGVAALNYRASVVSREAFRSQETTRTGATIYSELVTLEDTLGRTVVRELTIAEPNSNLKEVSPIPIVTTDAWTTGPQGLNRDTIRGWTDLGYKVYSLHHAAQFSPIARDKSVNRSAHQIHATLDDLTQKNGDYTDEVISEGLSRAAMTGEKLIALASLYGRKVPFSDLDAICFAKDMTTTEKLNSIRQQLPGEVRGIGTLALQLLQRSYKERNPGLLREYARTVPLHPRNLIQEAMWAPALIRSNVGHSVGMLPQDTVGVRTFMSTDVMSQQLIFEKLYKPFDGIVVASEKGPHVAGAFPEYLDKKRARFGKVLEFIHNNGMSITGIDAHDLVDSSQNTPKLQLLK